MKPSILAGPLPSTFALLLLLAAASPVLAQAPARPPVHSLDLLVNDASARVLVNGFPICSLPDEGNYQRTQKLIAQYLKKGANTIEVIYKPLTPAAGTPPAASRLVAITLARRDQVDAAEAQPVMELERIEDAAEAEPNCRTKIKINDQDAYSLAKRGDAGSSLMRVSLDPASLSVEPLVGEESRLRLEAGIPDAGLDDLPWVGPVPVVDEAARTAMRGRVTQVRNALANRAYADLAAALDAKYTRVAAAMGVPKEEIIAGEVQLLAGLTGTSGFAIKPLDPALLEFQLIEGFNLVKVLLAAGPPITGGDEDIAFSLDLYFSKIGEEWVLVE